MGEQRADRTAVEMAGQSGLQMDSQRADWKAVKSDRLMDLPMGVLREK